MPPTKRGRKPKVDRAVAAIDKSLAAVPLERVPEPPDHLSDVSKAYWLKLAPQLIELRILTNLHLESFAVLCQVYGDFMFWQQWLQGNHDRHTTQAESGYRQKSPEVTMRDQALSQLQKIWPKFGLTPFALAQMRKHGGISGGSLPPIVDFAKRKYEDEEEEIEEDDE
jgi:P27 family predicted phage terminase small subunit